MFEEGENSDFLQHFYDGQSGHVQAVEPKGFRLIAVTDAASCPRSLVEQVQRIGAGERNEQAPAVLAVLNEALFGSCCSLELAAPGGIAYRDVESGLGGPARGAGHADAPLGEAFYRAQQHTAQVYFAYVLPQVHTFAAQVHSGGEALLAVPFEAY